VTLDVAVRDGIGVIVGVAVAEGIRVMVDVVVVVATAV